MSNPVVAITGANGFVGSALVKSFLDKGMPTVKLVRTLSALPITEERVFELETPPVTNLLHGIDVLIHCAFVSPTEKNAGVTDYDGTAALIELARKNDIKKIIFFSTVSAHDAAVSSYGISKYKMEKLLNTEKDAIVKPALIIGNGGLFQRLLKQALTKKTVPLIENGKQPMQVIALEDVIRAVHSIIDRNLAGTFVLANEEKFSYKDMFKQIASVYGVFLRFLPLPVFPVKMALSISDMMGVKLPVSKENLSGLQSLKYMDPQVSLKKLELKPANFRDTLTKLKKDIGFS